MKRRIILGFFVTFLIFGLGSAAIINNLLRSTNNLQYLLNLHKIENMRQNLNLRVQKVQSYVHLSALDFSYNIDEIVTNIQGLETTSKNCLTCHHEEDIAKDIAYTQELIHNYEERLSYLITSASDDTWRSDNQKQAVKLADTIINHVQEMVNRSAATLQHKTDLTMKQIKKTYLFLSMTMIGTVITALIIGQYLTKKITTPIDQLLLATKKLTSGELGYTTDYQANDEFGQLQKSFNEMSLALAAKDQENKQLALDLQKKIDELGLTQQQLITAGKLAALGKLAGGISHDFNNLLCGMLGYITIIKKQISSHEAAADNLATLEQAALRAANLVQRLQTFASQKECQQLPVNINEVVVDVQQAIRASFGQNYSITLSLDEHLAQIIGDYASLKELLFNVCENSIESFPADGQGVVEIVTQNCTVHNNQDNNRAIPARLYVKISVTDNGAGIHDGNLKQIFDPYFSTRERSARKGMGLGMAIAFSIAKKHNGYLYIDSEEGTGTQVDIYLPALRPETSAV